VNKNATALSALIPKRQVAKRISRLEFETLKPPPPGAAAAIEPVHVDALSHRFTLALIAARSSLDFDSSGAGP